MTIIIRHQGQIKTADLTTDHAASSYGRAGLVEGLKLPGDRSNPPRGSDAFGIPRPSRGLSLSRDIPGVPTLQSR